MNRWKPRQVRKIMWILYGLGVLIALVGMALSSVPVMVIGLVVLVSGIVFYFLFYRCPHCGRYLDRSTGEFCPYCGARVNE